MSPFRTLMSAGSSSKLNLRRKEPMRVTLKRGPRRWDWKRIVLNFNTSKSVPFWLMREYLTNTGPDDSNLMRAGIIRKGEANRRKATSPEGACRPASHQEVRGGFIETLRCA
jgi:hypothetical protein